MIPGSAGFWKWRGVAGKGGRPRRGAFVSVDHHGWLGLDPQQVPGTPGRAPCSGPMEGVGAEHISTNLLPLLAGDVGNALGCHSLAHAPRPENTLRKRGGKSPVLRTCLQRWAEEHTLSHRSASLSLTGHWARQDCREG